jgi:hypothetical protein
MDGLVAHGDTRRVSLGEVMAVPTPDRTKTWGVIGHDQLLNTLTGAITEAGHEIVKQEFSLSKDGGKMFGAFTLDHRTKSMAWMIGVRNSIDKSLKVGITAGTRVFVCDNLAFSGDFIRFRKHTGRLDGDELRVISIDAVAQMEAKLLGFQNWQESLDTYDMTRQDAEALTFRAVDKDVVSGGRFGSFYDLFFKQENKENDAEYEMNLGGFHGAVTQLWKKNSLIGAGNRHLALQLLMNEAKDELNEHGLIRNA